MFLQLHFKNNKKEVIKCVQFDEKNFKENVNDEIEKGKKELKDKGLTEIILCDENCKEFFYG